MKKRILFYTLFILYGFTGYAQLPAVENNGLVIQEPVNFKTGTAILEPDASIALNKVKAFLAAKTYISLMRVEGHTDHSGNDNSDQLLSEKRALAVCSWLTENGIDCKRLIAVGFGSSKPVNSNETSEGKAANRRMTFKLTALNGRVIGAMPIDGGGRVAGDPCN